MEMPKVTSKAEGAGDSLQWTHAARLQPGSNGLFHAPSSVTVRPHGAIHQLHVGFLTYAEDVIRHFWSLHESFGVSWMFILCIIAHG